MKKNSIVSTICWIVIGLVIGYLIFAKGANGKYIPLDSLILPAKNSAIKAINKVRDLGTIRLQILGCGVAGAAFGYIFGKLKK
ncbi:MAG: hypothetical protein J6U56_04990 [Spirochaetia bacterium]|nr:hypothetical protein [Spirochaetia bacterium]